MFGIGTEELLLILVIALVVVGPERMPKLARDLGRMVGEFRKTSDELRNEFLNADSIIDVAARSASAPAPEPTSEAVAPAKDGSVPGEPAPATAIDAGVPLTADALLAPGAPEALTETAVTSEPAPGEPMAAEPEPDESIFDREAREARLRLQDPARARQAAAEGWTTPTDEAGTTDRWG